jgi:hypothetical protein
MSIPFIQFLRPDGRRKAVEIDMPEEVENLAATLIEAGCRFEIEELTTGMVNMECMLENYCVAGELCPNGPPVPDAVEKLIRNAYARLDR